VKQTMEIFVKILFRKLPLEDDGTVCVQVANKRGRTK
jgi:hypothetical protein